MTLYVTQGLLALCGIAALSSLFMYVTSYSIIILVLAGICSLSLLPLYRYATLKTSRTHLDTFVMLLIAATGIAYRVVGFMVLSHRFFHMPTPSVLGAFHLTASAMKIPDGAITSPTKVSAAFLTSLNTVAIHIVGAIIGRLLRLLTLQTARSSRELSEVTRLLEEFPSGPNDYFKLWPTPKRYYFSQSRHAAITYLPVREYLFVFGDPNGDPQGFADLAR